MKNPCQSLVITFGRWSRNKWYFIMLRNISGYRKLTVVFLCIRAEFSDIRTKLGFLCICQCSLTKCPPDRLENFNQPDESRSIARSPGSPEFVSGSMVCLIFITNDCAPVPSNSILFIAIRLRLWKVYQEKSVHF